MCFVLILKSYRVITQRLLFLFRLSHPLYALMDVFFPEGYGLQPVHTLKQNDGLKSLRENGMDGLSLTF